MKKSIFIVVVLVLFSAILSAQDSTWTNPFDAASSAMPRSMLSSVSNGLLYDGFDVILAAPSELSNYQGVSVYGSLGNYESWAEDGNVSVSLGSLLSLFGIQGGLVGAFDRLYTDCLVGWPTTPASSYKVDGTPNNQDGDSDGIYSYTNSESYNYADQIVAENFKAGVGVDLGFMGLSLYGDRAGSNRIRGGSYEYKWTVGADVGSLPANELNPAGKSITTSKAIKYGFSNGASVSDPVNDWSYNLALTGQYPWSFLGVSSPLTATFRIGAHQHGISDGIPQSVTVKDAYVGTDGAGGAAGDVSTLTYTVGVGDFGSTTLSGTHLGTGLTVSQATMAAATAASALGYALDPAGYVNDDYLFAFACRADPKIPLSDVLTAKTRIQLGMSFCQELDRDFMSKSVSLDRADSAATNSTFSYNDSRSRASSTSNTVIAMEGGALLEAKGANGFIVVTTGLFYNPILDLSSLAHETGTMTIIASAVDKTGASAEATSATTLGDIALGKTQGSVTETSTVSYSGNDSDNVYTHRVLLPVTAQFNLVKDKLSFICGCLLSGTITDSAVSTAAYTTSKTTSVSSNSGTLLTASPTPVDTATEATSSETWSDVKWDGALNFMIRWVPQENLTLDIYGKTLTDAINADQFMSVTDASDSHDGFQVNGLTSIGISVTFHI
jgi:hypothetical protein